LDVGEKKVELKNSAPLTLVRLLASAFRTITVPPGVPSLRHSAVPAPSLAVKKTAPPPSTNGPGEESAAVLKVSLMSLTRKACVSDFPCSPRTPETVVRSVRTSATTTVQAFEELRIAGFPGTIVIRPAFLSRARSVWLTGGTDVSSRILCDGGPCIHRVIHGGAEAEYLY